MDQHMDPPPRHAFLSLLKSPNKTSRKPSKLQKSPKWKEEQVKKYGPMKYKPGDRSKDLPPVPQPDEDHPLVKRSGSTPDLATPRKILWFWPLKKNRSDLDLRTQGLANAEQTVTATEVPNIVVFGETGSGKSSVINMLDGSNQAVVSNSAVGVTFSSDCYVKTIRNKMFHVYDTVGLGEADEGTVPTKEAIKSLYRLADELGQGINLLVLVFRGRINGSTFKNYKMFYEVFCQKQVPIVIVVTGLEFEDNMGGWWERNRGEFVKNGMRFVDSACITSTLGVPENGKMSLQAKYESSKDRLEDVILSRYSKKPWRLGTAEWATSILHNIIRSSNYSSRKRTKILARALEENMGMTRKEARLEAKKEVEGS